MSNYTIYQSRIERDSLFYSNDGSFNGESALNAWRKGDYVATAFVDGGSLGDAYEATQNSGVTYSGVKVFGIVDTRSTSVGDIILDRDTNDVYVVASFGFDLVGNLTDMGIAA